MDADVIVIGAGAAGLAAAHSLAVRSLRVVVLEARDRVGGRVLSLPMGGTAEPAELGAEFIHGAAPETMALLRKSGLSSIALAGDSWSRGKDGVVRIRRNEFLTAARLFEKAHSLKNDESVDAFLRRLDGAAREAAQYARDFVEGFDAADPAIASVKSIADELRSGVDYSGARPQGGYHPMFERLRGACVAAGAEIRFSTMVRRVSWRSRRAAVDALDARGEALTIAARVAIVTLPVGVLRDNDRTRIDFDPMFPSPKRAALQAVEMGRVVKVALLFREAFWERIHGGRFREAGFFRC
ncbi:MAG: FAD-dependent oxidoreductase, partial [Candidatus Eremiobacteraeota bacterium]|nr:FAD-dependent oxidoreductase [Candidatus Eremiobacteraeota bacterium]